jgi:hypothetical protein
MTPTAPYKPPGPVLRAFLESDAFARAAIGPIHAGRKTACAVDILRRAQRLLNGQRQWRWAVVRATLDELEAHTIPAWHKRVAPATGSWDPKGAPARHHVPFYDKDDRVTAELELIFFGLDRPEHRRKLATLDVTGLWLDAAKDLPQSVFDDAVAQAGTYPSALAGGAAWRGIVVSSRMPMATHWIPNLFHSPALAAAPPTPLAPGPDASDYLLFRQPSALGHLAENTANLPKGFYERIAAGKPQDWVRTAIEAEYGQVPEEIENAGYARDQILVRLDRLHKLAEQQAAMPKPAAA